MTGTHTLPFTTPVVTFTELGGECVTEDRVVAELLRLPLDGVLGVLAATSIQLLQVDDFADPRIQGGWLNQAIVDDFPSRIPRAETMNAPGRVPFTRGRHTFVHEWNLAWLANAALLYCDADADTPRLTHDLSGRVYRLLLIANDFLTSRWGHLPTGLEDLRQFCLDWLRAGQFNTFFGDPLRTLRTLERQRILLCELMPKHFPDIEEVFPQATGGLDADGYFRLLALVATHFQHRMRPGNHWLTRSTLARELQRDRGAVEAAIGDWILTPEEYRAAVEERAMEHPATGLRGSDLMMLRKCPLIEARPDELIAPVAPMVLAKITDGPFFLISDHLKGDRGRQGDFQKAHGGAFEDYARGLIARVAEAGGFRTLSTLKVRDGELADDYLQRNELAISFELKAGRAPTEFLIGGSGDRVLGPPAELVSRIEDGSPPDSPEGREKEDEGLLTRGLWQQTQHGSALLAQAESELGTRPSQVIPIFVHLAPLRVDATVWVSYLERLRKAAGLLTDEWWQPPQWLHIEDLESLVGFVETDGEDIGSILTQKIRSAPAERFDVFLFKRVGTRGTDPRLTETALEWLRSTGIHFFGVDPAGEHSENAPGVE